MKRLVSRSLMHLGLLVSSICFALIVFEALLRVANVSYPVFDDFDQARGVRLRPGKQGWYRAEGAAYLSINSLGYRDHEHDRTKPPTTIRIAVLGDSFVEARQVALEDTFWYRLGRELQACQAFDGRHVEMLSFGIGGYNTSQEYLTLQKDALEFSPDIVLLAVFPGNDIEGNWRKTEDTGAWRIPAPTHKIVDGQLMIKPPSNRSFFQILLYEMVHYSRVVEVVNEARRRMRALAWRSAVPDEIETGLAASVFKPPESPEWQEAWLVTDALLAEMNALVRSHGAKFVVTTIPSATEVDPVKRRREEVASRFGLKDFLYPDRQLAEIGAKWNFPVYPLTAELQKITEQRQIYLHGFENTRLGHGHLNKEGHQLIAELLAAKLCAPVGEWVALKQ